MSDTLTRIANEIEAILPDVQADDVHLARAAVAILRGDVEACMAVCDAIRTEAIRASLPPVLRQFMPNDPNAAR